MAAMSTKRLISAKLSAKVTAEGFLSAYMDFLKGETYLCPILDAYQRKELLPSVTFKLCQEAALQHWFQQEKSKADQRMEAHKEGGSATKVVRRKKAEPVEAEEEETHSSKYTVTLMCKVYDKAGNVTIQVGTVERSREVTVLQNGTEVTKVVKEEEPAIFKADSYNAAERLADRRLVERADAVYATIVNNVGKPLTTNIQRDDAIARTFKSPKGPATRNTSSSGGSNLGFGIKAKNDTCYFSRG
jgi:hypothetical protein